MRKLCPASYPRYLSVKQLGFHLRGKSIYKTICYNFAINHKAYPAFLYKVRTLYKYRCNIQISRLSLCYAVQLQRRVCRNHENSPSAKLYSPLQ